MAKTVKNTIKSKKPTNLDRDSDFKKSPWLEDYMSSSSFRLQPVTMETIERISKDLIEWAKKEDSLRVEDFHWERDICEKTYYRWKSKYEILELSHRKALNYLASRREKGSLFRVMDKETVFKRQHAYDPAWELDRQRDKQDKIDIAIAVKKAAMEMGESKPQVIVLSELEFKKKEENEKL